MKRAISVADGGRTWTPTCFAFKNGTGQFNDKPMITVDTNPNSPLRDTIYVTWDTATVTRPALTTSS